MKTYKIGFANLSEEQEFSRTVRASLEAAVEKHPDIELIVRDNALDNQCALANITEFSRIPVDLCILYHINERFNAMLQSMLVPQRIPILAVDIPVPLSPFFGVNNRLSGMLAGEGAIRWIQQNWDGQIDKLLAVTDSRVVSSVRMRLDRAVQQVCDELKISSSDVLYVDGENRISVSQQRVETILNHWQDCHRIMVIGLNDDSTLGALLAAHQLGRSSEVAGVGQGANLLNQCFGNPEYQFIGSVAYYPERYGESLLDLSLKMLNQKRLPPVNYIKSEFIDREVWLKSVS